MKISLSAALLFLAVPGAALAAGDALVHRDPGCGCCEKWAQMIRDRLGRKVVMREDPSRTTFQRRNGVPPRLSSCHTAVIDGMIFEGHVPIADIQRVLRTRPAGVKGLAVAGMPLGSDGMEVPGAQQQRHDVVAFGSGGVKIFTRH